MSADEQADARARRHRQDGPARPWSGSRRAGRGDATRPRGRQQPPFDWESPATWPAVLEGAGAAYVSYYPDLALPGAVEAVGSFAALAVGSGVRRLVLLAGRGEEEAELAEQAVRESGADLTVVRATWFAQNFSEDYMIEGVLAGEVALPAGDVPEPFVDADDIADVAVAALTPGRTRRRGLRVDRPPAAHVRRGGRGDRGRGRTRDPLPARLGRGVHRHGRRARSARRVRRAARRTCSPRSSTDATHSSPTACSARSAARRRTSRRTHAMPPRAASGTSASLRSPDGCPVTIPSMTSRGCGACR